MNNKNSSWFLNLIPKPCFYQIFLYFIILKKYAIQTYSSHSVKALLNKKKIITNKNSAEHFKKNIRSLVVIICVFQSVNL